MGSFSPGSSARSKVPQVWRLPDTVPGTTSAGTLPSVLVVEDEEGMQRYERRLLTAHGLEVCVVDTAAAALAELARHHHAAAIIDERLKDGGFGLEVLRAARQAGNSIPVIVLTGYGTPELAAETLRLGIVDYQCKPARTERLLATVRIAIRVGKCRALGQPPLVALHPDVPLPVLSVLMNLESADDDQLRTQLAWVAADEELTFVEFAGCIQALWHLTAWPPESEAGVRRQLQRCLTRAVEARIRACSAETERFLGYLQRDLERFRTLNNRGIAELVRVEIATLSRRLHEDLGMSPEDCVLIAAMRPALQHLAHSHEQIAQIGYQVGISHHGTFDRVFRRALGIAPSEYRRLLTGGV